MVMALNRHICLWGYEAVYGIMGMRTIPITDKSSSLTPLKEVLDAFFSLLLWGCVRIKSSAFDAYASP